MDQSLSFGRISFRILRAGAGLLLLLLIGYVLIRNVDARRVAETLKQVNLLWIALALLSVTGTIWIRGARWQVLLGPERVSSAVVDLARIVALGQVINSFVPGRFGEAYRAYAAGDSGVDSKLYALGTLVAEKLLDLLMLLVVAGITLLWMPVPEWVLKGVHVALWGLGALAAVTLAAVLLRDRSRRVLSRIGAPDSLGRWLEALTEGAATLRPVRVFLAGSAWSVLLWVAYLFNNWAILRSLDILSGQQALAGSMLVLIVVQVGMIPPSTPAGLGVFEYLCVLALGLLGVSPEAALSFGLVLHAVVLLPPLIWGALYLVGSGWRSRNAQ